MKIYFLFGLLLAAVSARAEVTQVLSCESGAWRMKVGFEKMSTGYDNASVSVDAGQNHWHEFVIPVHQGDLLNALANGLLMTSVEDNKEQALVMSSGRQSITWANQGRMITFNCKR